MGLDTTHGCWNGPYSYFGEWRKAVANAAGIPDLDAYWRDKQIGNDSTEHLHGLWMTPPEGGALAILLNHSDCEGYILSHHCADLADALETLLPKMQGHAQDTGSPFHLTQRFIKGLRRAAEAGQNVEFH